MSVLIVTLFGCTESGDVPAYLHLSDYVVHTKAGEGSASHKITDAWVFVNGRSLGAYQLPAILPVIAEGETNVDIFPVIKENGVSAHSLMYPFYTKLDTVIDFDPPQETRIELQTSYHNLLDFKVLEDFEGGHFFTSEIDEDDGTKIEITTTDAFEGTASGKIVLNADNPILEAGWQDFTFPKRGGLAFVELNYKANTSFVIGLRGFKDGIEIKRYDAVVNARDEWNKIYFNFSEYIEPDIFDQYHLVIVGVWTEELNLEEVVINIDNVKLIVQE